MTVQHPRGSRVVDARTQPLRAAELPAVTGVVPLRRQLLGAGLVVAGLPLLTALIIPHRDTVSLAAPALLVLLVVVVGSLLGGLRVGLPAAVGGGLMLNWFFTVPYGTLAVTRPEQVLVLAVYLTVAVSVSVVVGVAARRTAEATRSRAEADALAAAAGAALAELETLPQLLEQIRGLFGMRVVRLLEKNGDDWATVDSVSDGGNPAADEVELRVTVSDTLVLSVAGPPLFGEDRRVLHSFADAAANALTGRRLALQAAAAERFEAADRMRTALLAAVGHDLRTPLAGVKAAVSSLRQRDIEWTREESDLLLETIEESADRLQHIVANLLDASRLQAGLVTTTIETVGIEEIIDRSLLMTTGSERVAVAVAPGTPDVAADIGLAERVLVNLLDNALRHSPGPTAVTVRAAADDGRVECAVIDHGPGVPADLIGRIFTAFQRFDDHHAGGVGLGLAVARGFAEAMNGTLDAVATEGGGLTMRLRLPVAPTSPVRQVAAG
jgi:two-component system sensor histidine kinase KdpD